VTFADTEVKEKEKEKRERVRERERERGGFYFLNTNFTIIINMKKLFPPPPKVQQPLVGQGFLIIEVS
jgi:hypothetical protein